MEENNIKNLYSQITDKKSFINECAKRFGIKPISVKNNWFSSMFNVPEEHRVYVIDMMQKQIFIQNQSA